MKNPRIALIVCYFGKLPWYFNYFLHSCNYNPSVTFFLITDDKSNTFPLPPHVNILYKTLLEVSAIASTRLNLSIDIQYGYKLCDFKPAYGFIFSDLIQGFDFWGHTDLDIIFGNIREFISDEILECHDLISVRPDWITGCFLLYKNNEKMNTLFKHSKDYKKVFSSAEHYCFDETNFSHDAFHEGANFIEINTKVESMMHVVKKLEAINYIRPYFDLHIVEGVPGNLKWVNGRMYYKNQFEVLLYHMIEFKNKCIVKNNNRPIPDSFSISPTRIYHHTNLKLLHAI